MTDLPHIYWRFPRWLRLTAILVLTVVAALVVDALSPSHHSVNIAFLAVVLVVWGLVGTAEQRHSRGQ